MMILEPLGTRFGGEPFHAIHQLREPATGLRGYIAIHSLARGPAFGGCRFRAYASEDEAITDAMRLAEGMTYKNALAELPFGGGKAVLIRTPEVLDRPACFRAFGRAVDRLHGQYITAEDVGTTPADMKAVRSETAYVSGIPRDEGFGGDPGRFTALGVFLSIQAAAIQILGRQGVKGLKVAIQGVGAVGAHLCGELVRAGAEVSIADIDSARADAVREMWDVRLFPVSQFLDQRVHVLAPCAMGGILRGKDLERIKAPVVAGAANNQLGGMEDGDRLHERGVWYLPDFLVNAGGIIAVGHEYLGGSSVARVMDDVAGISDRVERLIREVRRLDEPPARLALAWAKSKVQARGS